MERQTIQDIAAVLVARNGLDKTEANRFVTEMFALIQERLETDKIVKVKGLGTFKIVGVEARESVSVRTGQRVVIDGHSKITFIPDAIMKDLVNKPFSQFETVVLNDGVDFEDLKAEEQDMAVPIDEDTEEVSTPIEEEHTVSESAEEEPVVPASVEERPKTPSVQPLMEVVDDQPAADNSEEEPTSDDDKDEVEPVSNDGEDEPVSSDDEDEPVSDDNAEEPAYEEESQSSWLRWLLGGLLVLALMAASAYGGYYFGSQKQVQPVVPDTVVIHDTVTVVPIDTVAAEAAGTVDTTEATEATDAAKAADTESAVASSKVEKKEPPVAEPDVDKYAEKDARVRLGAYRIVGLDHKVTVLAGQTFYSICRAHLGPDMECYVEVYNDLPKNPVVKAGQVIKIPKLQLKKRRKTNKS